MITSGSCFHSSSTNSFDELVLGNGFSGTSTSRKSQSGCQPSRRIEGEKAVGGDFRLHLGDVLPEDPIGMVPFRHSVVEDLDHDCLVAHLGDRVHVRRRMLAARRDERRDRRLHAVEPGVRIAHRQDHLGLGKMLRELAPVSRPRPVDLRPVTAEDLVPVDRLASRRRLPIRREARDCRGPRTCDGKDRNPDARARASENSSRCGRSPAR